MKKEKDENGNNHEGELQEEDITVGGDSCLTDRTLWMPENTKGPNHILQKIGHMGKVEYLYELADLKTIDVFVNNILKQMVGVREWNMNIGAEKRMNEFVSTSDIAFSLLVLENNADKWLEEINEPEQTKHTKTKARYSQGGCKGPGWTCVSISRYVDIQNRMKRLRKVVVERPKSKFSNKIRRLNNRLWKEFKENSGNCDQQKNMKKLEEMKRRLDGVIDDGRKKKKDLTNMALLEATRSCNEDSVITGNDVDIEQDNLSNESDDILQVAV